MNTGVSSFFDLGQINQWNESSTIRSDAQYNVFKFKVYESLSCNSFPQIVKLVLIARESVEHISKTDLVKILGIKMDSLLS
jgi:hypothetical protein